MKGKRKTSSKSKKKELKEPKAKTKVPDSPKQKIKKEIQNPLPQENTQYQTLRINCIENIPSSIEDIFTIKEINLLALCRSDNTIELWTTNTWIQLYKFPGLKNIQTRRVWLTYKNSSQINNDIFNSIRLFSVGLSGYFIEWDFQTMLPKYIYKNSSAIWDFKIKNKLCLLASYDGKVEIIKIKKNENPFLVKSIPTRDNILSICFENSTNNIFYTGHSNGIINKLNLQTGQTILSINTSLNIKNTEEKNMIWILCSINSQFLFAGDSTGRVLILDMKVGNINQEINEHKGDILTMCFNNNLEQPIIYYSGVDSLIGCIKYDKKNNLFIYTSSFRGQSHDVNSLALLDDDTLLSGGNTTDICIYHLFNGGNLYQKYDKKVNTNIKRHISPFEHKVNYHISKANKDKIFFILHQKSDYVDLWNVNMNNQINTFVAKIYKSKKIEGNIICSNLSFDAKIIAISYDKITVVFSYDFDSNEIKKIGTIKYQANFIFINNKYQIILLSQNENKLFVYDLIKNEENKGNSNKKYNIIENKFIVLPKNTNINIDNILEMKSDSNKNQLILCSQFKEEKNIIAYSTLNKQLYLIDINNSTYESLPHPDKYITKISFSLDNSKIITIDENNKIYLIDLNTKKFDQWTNDRIKKEDYPLNYIKWYNRIFGICALGTDRYILYTDYNYILLDLTLEIPNQCIIEKNKMDKYIYSNYEKLIKEYHRILFEKEYRPGNPLVQENKSIFLSTEVNRDKNLYNLQNNNFKITSRFNSIMYMNLISFIDEENNIDDKDKNKYLLVIENDWNNIIKSFPGALVRHKYGH
jgi:WD40 repeat protein